MARPKSLKEFDEGQLRRDLVAVFGADSEQVSTLDDILHKMWAGENALTLVETIKGEFHVEVRCAPTSEQWGAQWAPRTRTENGVEEQDLLIDGHDWVPTAVITELGLL